MWNLSTLPGDEDVHVTLPIKYRSANSKTAIGICSRGADLNPQPGFSLQLIASIAVNSAVADGSGSRRRRPAAAIPAISREEAAAKTTETPKGGLLLKEELTGLFGAG